MIEPARHAGGIGKNSKRMHSLAEKRAVGEENSQQ
jgi:hypothetical protein